MTYEKEIYENSPERYDDLVSHEDHEGNILPALEEVRRLMGCDVIEMGAGTGRLTRLVIPIAKSVRAFDAEPAMLELAERKLKKIDSSNWSVGLGSHRSLPVESESADVVVSGWSVCYAVVDNPDSWERELGTVLAEAARVLRPGGTIILLETLGVGHDAPVPPTHLVDYFDYLDSSGFSKKWIRTDFKFDDPQQADELIRFFFGDKVADRAVGPATTTVAECTGIWWRPKPSKANS